ncbi:MAG: hypothetical protein EOP04_02855 [Proteobacteria bacterium]|nr:MAG: hypothetical protein EOP04_02855 [Pseudomonadota bacterium]
MPSYDYGYDLVIAHAPVIPIWIKAESPEAASALMDRFISGKCISDLCCASTSGEFQDVKSLEELLHLVKRGRVANTSFLRSCSGSIAQYHQGNDADFPETVMTRVVYNKDGGEEWLNERIKKTARKFGTRIRAGYFFTLCLRFETNLPICIRASSRTLADKRIIRFIEGRVEGAFFNLGNLWGGDIKFKSLKAMLMKLDALSDETIAANDGIFKDTLVAIQANYHRRKSYLNDFEVISLLNLRGSVFEKVEGWMDVLNLYTGHQEAVQ